MDTKKKTMRTVIRIGMRKRIPTRITRTGITHHGYDIDDTHRNEIKHPDQNIHASVLIFKYPLSVIVS